jgi:Ca-activated chloride channel homolog
MARWLHTTTIASQGIVPAADDPNVTGKWFSTLAWMVLLTVASWMAEASALALPDANASGIGAAPSLSLGANDLNLTIAKAALPEFTIRRTVPEVRLQFTVVDEHGRDLKPISSDDLQIFDNRMAVARIRDFSRTENVPLEIGILLDVSDSVEKNAQRERQVTQYFLDRVVRSSTDRVALMAFSNEVTLVQESTEARDVLIGALARLPQRGYLTYLYDSLYRVCSDRFTPLQTGKPVQRILLLISDGEDTGSLHPLADAISVAQRSDIQIYAVSVHPSRQSPAGDKVLKQLADSTGGQSYVVWTEKDFPLLFSTMERLLRTQYFVSFQPVDLTPGFHTVQIQLAGGGNVQVRSRRGYYFDTH